VDLESELARENIRPRYTWEQGRIAFGDIETDAHFLYATVSGSRFRFSASQVMNLYFQGHPIMEALPNTYGLQPDGSPQRVGYTKWRAWEDDVELK
jgi:hypothetical protein